MERGQRDQIADASEIEGGGVDQTWGQGTGRHEPTTPAESDQAAEEQASTYTGGAARELDDPDLPLSREDEGMDR